MKNRTTSSCGPALYCILLVWEKIKIQSVVSIECVLRLQDNKAENLWVEPLKVRDHLYKILCFQAWATWWNPTSINTYIHIYIKSSRREEIRVWTQSVDKQGRAGARAEMVWGGGIKCRTLVPNWYEKQSKKRTYSYSQTWYPGDCPWLNPWGSLPQGILILKNKSETLQWGRREDTVLHWDNTAVKEWDLWWKSCLWREEEGTIAPDQSLRIMFPKVVKQEITVDGVRTLRNSDSRV